ncbi:MAG: hypothetical protein KDK30_09355, partial [Leptospiraceae bacterium]|nr:hypothetical protein [Leptospiraceae bacterium]
MKRKHLLAGSIVLILLMIGILAILLSNDDNDITNMEEQMFDPEQHFHIREGAEGFPSPRELEKMINEGPTPEAQLVAYRLYSRYPPDSRPLSRDMRDLTNPWQIKYVPLPIMNDPRARSEDALKKMIDELVAQGKTREEIMEQLNEEARESPRFVFELNRHTVTANDELKAILVVTDSGGSPLSIDLMSAEMKSDGHFGNIGLGSVPYDQKGPGNYLFTWKAPSADKKYWGSLTLEVRARVPGIEDEVTLTQGFYSSPIAPARFTGNASERLEKGSLLIDVELDVERECRYSLHANLYSVIDDEPTHWASVDEILKPGRQVVSFKFFGKVF